MSKRISFCCYIRFLVLFSYYFVLDSLFFVEPGLNITTTGTTTLLWNKIAPYQRNVPQFNF